LWLEWCWILFMGRCGPFLGVRSWRLNSTFQLASQLGDLDAGGATEVAIRRRQSDLTTLTTMGRLPSSHRDRPATHR
jgi:hypothetical protein